MEEERAKKWIRVRHLGMARIAIFVISLDFEVPSLHDKSLPNILHNLAIFEEYSDSTRFGYRICLLVFTFRDVFEELLSEVEGREAFSRVFPEYNGNYDWKDAYAFVRNEFKSKKRCPENILQCWVVNALEMNVKGMIKWMHSAEKRIELNRILHEAGLDLE